MKYPGKVIFKATTKPGGRGADKPSGAGCASSGPFGDKGRIRNVKIWTPSTAKRKFESFPKAE